jgi:WD40 repeat protein
MQESETTGDVRRTIPLLVLILAILTAIAVGVGGRIWLLRSNERVHQNQARPTPLQMNTINIPASIHSETVTAIALGRNHLLALGTANGRVRIVDQQLRPLPKWEWIVKGIFMDKLAFSPDGSVLAGVTDQGELWTWRFSSDESHVMKMKLSEHVTAIALSPNGQRLVAVGFNVFVFDVQSGKLTRTFEQPTSSGGTGQYEAVAFTADSTAVVAVGLDQGGSQTPQGEETTGKGGADTWTLTGPANTPPTRLSCKCPTDGAAISHDGRVATFGTNDAHVVVWDAQRRSLIGDQTVSAQSGDHVYGTAVSADGKRVAAGTANGDLLLWDPTADFMLGRARFSGQPIVSIDLSDDGKLLLVEGQKENVGDSPLGARDRWLVTLS